MNSNRAAKCALWILLAGLLGACGGGTPQEQALEVAGQFQLFVDDYVVREMRQVTRRLNPLKKHPANPILKPDRPWEGQFTHPNFVVFDQDDRLYKMWYVYIDRDQEPGEQYLRVDRSSAGRAYAVSRDGIAWEKPDLGLVRVPGAGLKNNAVIHNPSLYDIRDPDPRKRYKAVIGTGDNSRDMGVAFSPDGLRWTPYPGNPVIDQKVGAGKVIWDDRIQRYVGFLRPLPSPPVAAMGNVSIRVIGRSTSPDFLKWDLPQNQVVLAPDEQDPMDTQFYTASVFKDRGVYFAFLSVYHANSLMVDIQLAFSRDGIEWQRVGKRHPILTYGMPDRFDSHGIYVYSPPVVLEEEIRVYYLGQDEGHTLTPGDLAVMAHRPAALPPGTEEALSEYRGAAWWFGVMPQPWALHGGAGGLALARRDGFVSLDAGADPGEVVTRTLWCRGGTLVVNADASDPSVWRREVNRWKKHPGGQGEIRVELLDENGSVLSGFEAGRCDPIRADSVAHAVSWNGQSELSLLQDRKIRIRFLLRNAKLYSFRLGN